MSAVQGCESPSKLFRFVDKGSEIKLKGPNPSQKMGQRSHCQRLSEFLQNSESLGFTMQKYSDCLFTVAC